MFSLFSENKVTDFLYVCHRGSISQILIKQVIRSINTAIL